MQSSYAAPARRKLRLTLLQASTPQACPAHHRAAPFARLLYKLEHFQRQAHNTGRAATLNTENQRLLFTRAHENDHSLPKAWRAPPLPSSQDRRAACSGCLTARSRFGYRSNSLQNSVAHSDLVYRGNCFGLGMLNIGGEILGCICLSHGPR